MRRAIRLFSTRNAIKEPLNHQKFDLSSYRQVSKRLLENRIQPVLEFNHLNQDSVIKVLFSREFQYDKAILLLQLLNLPNITEYEKSHNLGQYLQKVFKHGEDPMSLLMSEEIKPYLDSNAWYQVLLVCEDKDVTRVNALFNELKISPDLKITNLSLKRELDKCNDMKGGKEVLKKYELMFKDDQSTILIIEFYLRVGQSDEIARVLTKQRHSKDVVDVGLGALASFGKIEEMEEIAKRYNSLVKMDLVDLLIEKNGYSADQTRALLERMKTKYNLPLTLRTKALCREMYGSELDEYFNNFNL